MNNINWLKSNTKIWNFSLSKEAIEELTTKVNNTTISIVWDRFNFDKLNKLSNEIDSCVDKNIKLKLINDFFNIYNIFLITEEKDKLIFPSFFKRYIEYKKYIFIFKINMYIDLIEQWKENNFDLHLFLKYVKEYQQIFWSQDLVKEFWEHNLQYYIDISQDRLKNWRKIK